MSFAACAALDKMESMTREELIDAATAAATADPRTLGFWLTGSLGAGTADAWSDVDAIWIVAPEGHHLAVQGAREWVGSFLDVVLWRQVYPPHPLFHAASREWLRFDLTITTADRLSYTQDQIFPLSDRAGLYASLPATLPPRGPAPAAVHRIIEEFLRILGAAPVGFGRKEYVVLTTGAGLLRGLLIELMIAEQSLPRPPGALHLSRVLPPEDMDLLNTLPLAEPTLESNLRATRAMAEAFLPRAKALAQSIDLEWPADLEAACRGHLQRELGLTLST